MLELSQTCPEKGNDASEVPAVMTLLWKNDSNGGVDSVGKKKRSPSKTKGFTVGMDVALDGACAYNAFLLARVFGFGVRVSAEMTLFGEGAVEKDAESMEGSAVEVRISFMATSVGERGTH